MGFSALDISGPAPSKEEAVEAVYDLQMKSLPTTMSHSVEDEVSFFSEGAVDRTPLLHEKVKWEPSYCQPGQQDYKLCSALSVAQHKILNALHLLWTNSTVKNMVVSLSTDKAVWNAIMKNEKVQEFKKTYHADKYLKHVEFDSRGSKAQWSDGSPDITAVFLRWLFGIAKGVVMKFIEDVISLVNKLFDQQQAMENAMDVVSDLVNSSFLLSVLVCIIVILKRN